MNHEAITQAHALGVEHARNAATWTVDGNTGEDHVRFLLEGLEDGDPAIYHYLPPEPNLSGEYADDLTPGKLADELDVEPQDADDLDALADAYEAGVSETFESACESELRNALVDPDADTQEEIDATRDEMTRKLA